MSAQNESMVWVVVVAVICLGVVAALVVLKRKSADTADAHKTATLFLNGADQITDVLKGIYPMSPLVNIVDKIVDYAKVAVGNAEQLYLVDEIDRGDRKDAAAEYLYKALQLAGYEITPEVKKIADGALEAAVLALGHGFPVEGIAEGIAVTQEIEVEI